MAGSESTVPDYPRGITFEQVWAALMEDRKENDRIIKELSVQMGGLYRSFGELAEHLVAPGIASCFNEIGYHFDSLAPQGIEIYDESRKKILTEIDLLLENGECLMAVEVKTKPSEKDIAHHTGRLEIPRAWREKRQEKPKRILEPLHYTR
jgi:predicted AAA+ superfamily ATPase